MKHDKTNEFTSSLTRKANSGGVPVITVLRLQHYTFRETEREREREKERKGTSKKKNSTKKRETKTTKTTKREKRRHFF